MPAGISFIEIAWKAVQFFLLQILNPKIVKTKSIAASR